MSDEPRGWGGRRAGAGRRASEAPPRLLRIAATDAEMEHINVLTPRERAEALLAVARERRIERAVRIADDLTGLGAHEPGTE